jgi:hypothetical protein
MKKVILIALMLIFAQVLSAQFYPYNPNLGLQVQPEFLPQLLIRELIKSFRQIL